MAICARTIEQPDGALLLAADPTVSQLGNCAYVLQTGSEWAMGSLSTMTPEDALAYSGGIGLVWVTAWAFKVAIRALNVGDSNEQNG